jgi:hypothetical protein
MRARALILILMILLIGGAGGLAQSGSEEKLFQDIKLLVFDEKWAEALSRLDAFLDRTPADTWAVPALYYRAKCLEEIGGREKDALLAYKEYLRRDDRNKSLGADAEASIIDLALKLYAQGDRSFLPDVEERLTHPEKDVRYYAAIQLSYIKEKKASAKSIPILKKIMSEESSSELRDRAKIALLRVDPEALAQFEDRPAAKKVRMIHFQILDTRTNSVELSLNLPLVLADLALAGMSENDRALLRARGYALDKILKELTSVGNILEIKDEKEGKIIKIWID